MSLSHIDLADELPLIEHRQHHTQELLMKHDQSPCAAGDLLRAQVLDLLDDAGAGGLGQEHVLATCLEAIRQLRASDPSADWAWGQAGLEVVYRYAIGSSYGNFVNQDIVSVLDALPEDTITQTLGALGPATSLEQAEGLPDPERLIVGAALTLLRCYLLALGGTLNARYSVGGRPSWAAARLAASFPAEQ